MSNYHKKAFKYYLYTQNHAFLKWKRMFVRHRELQALNVKEMSNVEMSLCSKRRLVREIAYYAGTSDYQPLKPLDVYDYTSENELLLDTDSYGFVRSPLAGSLTQERSSSVKDSTLDQTEEVDESSISRSSESVNSPSAESSNEPSHRSAASQISGSVKSPSAAESVNDTSSRSTNSRSSESVNSPSAESCNEPSHRSSASQISGSVKSPSAAELVNDTSSRSTTSRSSESVNSPSAEINESNRRSSTSQISEPVESQEDRPITEISNKSNLSPTEPEEDEFDTANEWVQEAQATPEWSRKSVDCDSEMISLSPALSALNITRESGEECESEKSIEDFSRNSIVPFFEGRKFPRYPNSRIDENIASSELAISEPPDRVEINSSRMLLIPSNVRPKVRELALKFAKHFHYGAKERDADKGSLDVRVSHVIMDRKIPDPLQFAQIQAIGCKRYLVSAKWLWDSLKADQILSEDSYDILDPPFSEPSRRARLSPKNLFRGFAIIMCKPFVSFKQSEMEQLLSINGAQIYYHPKEFANSPNLARLCIVDVKYYRKGKLRKLLKLKKKIYKFVVVRYEWLHNSFLAYQLQPILKYLHDSEREEALEVGVPPEFLED